MRSPEYPREDEPPKIPERLQPAQIIDITDYLLGLEDIVLPGEEDDAETLVMHIDDIPPNVEMILATSELPTDLTEVVKPPVIRKILATFKDDPEGVIKAIAMAYYAASGDKDGEVPGDEIELEQLFAD